jgi:hypothetical protein
MILCHWSDRVETARASEREDNCCFMWPFDHQTASLPCHSLPCHQCGSCRTMGSSRARKATMTTGVAVNPAGNGLWLRRVDGCTWRIDRCFVQSLASASPAVVVSSTTDWRVCRDVNVLTELFAMLRCATRYCILRSVDQGQVLSFLCSDTKCMILQKFVSLMFCHRFVRDDCQLV